MIFVRDDYAPAFGRQVLTLWSGPFASDYEGQAVALPKLDGYMVTARTGAKVRVSCPAPRTEDNYQIVDEALVSAFVSLIGR